MSKPLTETSEWNDWPAEDVAVFTAANGWDQVRMADHQFAAALSEIIPVLYVEPPASVASRMRARGAAGAHGQRRLVREGLRLARLTPEALPGLSRPELAATNGRIVATQIRRALGRLGNGTRVHIEANALTPTLGCLRGATRLYWAQDDFVGMAPLVGVPAELYERTERRILQKADTVVAANPVVAESIRARGHQVGVIPFGCDVDLFAQARDATPADDVDLQQPIAILMGTLNERLDLQILAEVAASGTSLLIVGPKSPRFDSPAFRSLVGNLNVQWLGSKDFRELPSYLAHAKVGIVPYTRSRFNEGSFPLKTLEYLSAGLAVVATDLPAIRWLACPDVAVESEASAFAQRVTQLAAGRAQTDVVARRMEFASSHTWAARARAFAIAAGILPR